MNEQAERVRNETSRKNTRHRVDSVPRFTSRINIVLQENSTTWSDVLDYIASEHT
jgi:hypothetical protein